MIWDEMILHYWKVGFGMLGNIYVVLCRSDNELILG